MQDAFKQKVSRSTLSIAGWIGFETTKILRDFRAGDVPIIVTVDMLNEGIDIPDVNLIAFLRVTHSRRIFVQQLGRGLRLSQGKAEVRVLDFVSDVRRIAAARGLNQEGESLAANPPEEQILRYPDGQIVKFEGDEALSFFDEYLGDIAELEEGSDDSQLKFPTNETVLVEDFNQEKAISGFRLLCIA